MHRTKGTHCYTQLHKAQGVCFMKSGSRYRSFFVIFVLILTVLATISKIFVGYDTDEGYAVALSYRIAAGQKLLVDSWDVHQTSGILSAFLLMPYIAATGGVSGVFVYLRFCGAVLQALLAVYSYKVLKRCTDSFYAFIFAVSGNAFLPKEIQTIEHSYIVAAFSLLSVIFLIDYDISKSTLRKRITLILSAFSYAFAVFSYPTMILSVPFVAIALYCFGQHGIRQRIRLVLAFFSICAVSSLCFVLYLLNYIPAADLPFYFTELMNTGDHSRPFAALFERSTNIKLFAIVTAFLIAAVVLYFLLRRWLQEQIFIYIHVLLIVSLAVIVPNLTGLRPSGAMGLLERYGAILVAGLFFYFKLAMQDRRRYRLFIFYGIGALIGALMGTNQTIKENIQYIYPAVMGTIFLAMILTENQEKKKRFYIDSVLTLFVVGLLFCKGYVVRVTSTFPANITETRTQMTEGPLKGVWVYPEEAEFYTRISKTFSEHLSVDSSLQVIGRDPLLYLLSPVTMSCPSCIDTNIYNERWIEYYSADRHQLPDYLVIDLRSSSVEEFLSMPYGKWVQSYFDIDHPTAESNCVLFEKNN